MSSVIAVNPTGASFSLDEIVKIDYVNYRGVRGIRSVIPDRCYFGEVAWHPGQQWILDAWDLDKGALRSFAIADIYGWGV